ncbi:MAG: efflux RND transporter periplasmic adaptor subunit [Pseudomonadota bacterium]|nr:efflux RND transporter periplasmic adaptor subunit [Pseudomonadota bacterium]
MDKSNNPNTHSGIRKKLRIIGLGALLIALATSAAGIGLRLYKGAAVESWTSEQSIPTVALVALHATPAASEVVLPGNVRAFIDAPIYSRVGGYLKSWNVDIGAHVKAGQVLATIETPELDQQLLQAQADLATARANEQLSATTTARWARMLAAESVSKQEAEEKAGDHAAKKAIVAAAEANVARLRATASFKTIVSPFAGVVTARKTDIGALINAGAGSAPELFRVADASKVRVYVNVPQHYTAFLNKGGIARLIVPERPNEPVPAIITDSSQAITESSRTMLVQLEADNAKGALLPGSYVDVHFPLSDRAGLLRLPVSALVFRRHGLEVATLGANNKVVLKPVSLGRDFGTEVEIIGGIGVSDQVIDSPPDSLAEGDTVRLATPAANRGAGG